MKPQLTFWDIPIKGRVHSEVEPETFCSLLLMPWCHLGEWRKGGWQFGLPCLGNPEGSPWVMKQTFTHCSWRKHWGHLNPGSILCKLRYAVLCTVRIKWSFSLEVQGEISFPGVSLTHLCVPLHRITSDGISGLCGGHTVMRATGWPLGRSTP